MIFKSHKLTFPQIITTKSNCNKGNLGEDCEPPQRGPGQSPGCKCMLEFIFALQ